MSKGFPRRPRISVATTLEDVFARYTSDLADWKNAAYERQGFCCVSGGSHGFGKLRAPMNTAPKDPCDRLQRPPLRKRHHPALCPLVPSVPVKLSEPGGNDGGAWRRGRSFEHLPLGPEVHPPT